MLKVKASRTIWVKIMMIALSSALLLGLLPVTARSAGTDIIDLSEIDPQGGAGWTYARNCFTITGDVTITGSTTTRRISVQPGANVSITLNNASCLTRVSLEIKFGQYRFIMASAFDMADATVNLKLVGENSVAGIHVPLGASLIIDGSGSLTSEGIGRTAGIGGAYGTSGVDWGIYGDPGESGGSVTVNGGEVTAISTSGPGIGGGRGGDGAPHGGYGGDGGVGCAVTVNGGMVTAISQFCTGIGGGGGGAGGNGGINHPLSGNGGNGGDGGTLVINGGTLSALSQSGAAVGGGVGGAGGTNYIVIGGLGDTGVNGNSGTIAIVTSAYEWWANTESAGPGGAGTVFPPTAYVYSDTHKFVKIYSADTKSGVTITGMVASYNPNVSATVRLLRDGEELYKSDTGKSPGFGKAMQSFIFENVAPGDYALLVTKPGHVSYTVRNVTVMGEDVDLSATGAAGTMTMRCGDINGDDMINDVDLTILWMSGNYNNKAADAADPRCDLNGDGIINDVDLTILWMIDNYNKGAVVVG